MLPCQTLSIWNGIGGRHVGDRVEGLFGKQQHFPNCETLSELKQLGFRKQIAISWRLPQKIDAEVGCHREPYRADRRQQHDVHRSVRQRHQCRSRNSSAGTQHGLVKSLSYPARSTVSMLDRERLISKHQRKFGAQESAEFSYGHSRCVHCTLSNYPADRPPSNALTARGHLACRQLHHPVKSPMFLARNFDALSNLPEITVPPKPIAEAPCPRHAVRDQCLPPVVPFLNQSLADAKAMALDGRPSVGANADLGKARNLLRESFCFRASSSLRGQVFAQADRHALLGRHFASRQDNLECAALPDNARQPHRASIDQRHAPSTAINAKIRLFGHHPKIAPQSQLHAAGDRRTFNRRDDWFVQFQTRRSQRTAWNFAPVAARPGR